MSEPTILQRILDRIEAIPPAAWEEGQAKRTDMVLEHEVGDLVRRAVGLDNGS